MYWIDKTKLGGQGGGLGKVEYYHVHDDGTEHPASILPKNLTGEWISTPGVYCPQITVGCDDCGMMMQEYDYIQAAIIEE